MFWLKGETTMTNRTACYLMVVCGLALMALSGCDSEPAPACETWAVTTCDKIAECGGVGDPQGYPDMLTCVNDHQSYCAEVVKAPDDTGSADACADAMESHVCVSEWRNEDTCNPWGWSNR